MKRTLLITAILHSSFLILHSASAAAFTPACEEAKDWKLNAEISDEFAAKDLDRGKWDDCVKTFHGRSADEKMQTAWAVKSGFLFSPDNVAVENGELTLTARLLNDAEKSRRNEYLKMAPYAVSICRSRRKQAYGYFEIRAKTMKACVSNAFWLYDPHSDDPKVKFRKGDFSEEIDVFEVTGRPDSRDPKRDCTGNYYNTLHFYATPYLEAIVNMAKIFPQDGKSYRADFNFADDYHVYGLLWTPEKLVWYLDGKVTREEKNDCFHRPLHVTLDSEIFASWFGTPDEKDLPAKFRVDYVRVWECPPPRNTALVPRTKIETDGYDWFDRHRRILREKDRADVVFIGDSITHFWAGIDSIGGADALPRWKDEFGQWKTLDLGYGWDRTGNVLWRLDHGEMDGVDPKTVVLHVGGNNYSTTKNYKGNTAEEVAEAVLAIMKKIREKAPRARIVTMGVFPFGEKPDAPHRVAAKKTNAILATEVKKFPNSVFIDLTDQQTVGPDGVYPKSLAGDRVHPTDAGYAIWARAIKRYFPSPDTPVYETPAADPCARELSKPVEFRRLGCEQLIVVNGDRPQMSIVCGNRHSATRLAAEFLQKAIFEMTGVKLPLIQENDRHQTEAAPAFYVGEDVSACRRHKILAAAGLAEPLPTAKGAEDEEFVVTVRGQSYWFLGAAHLGVYDFCERVLGVRYYWDGPGGMSVLRTKGLRLPKYEWRDKPVFARRDNWPYNHTAWGRFTKSDIQAARFRYPNLHVHSTIPGPADTNFNFGARGMDDIYELNGDGKRTPPSLCYSNPKTIQAFEEVITAAIEKGYKAHIVDFGSKAVTISQPDAGVSCHCERCQRMYDPAMGSTGNASPVIWSYFAREISDWMAKKYPDWKLVILPYINTCGCPKGLKFPAGNVTAMLCTMPGLAMLKTDYVREHEQALIREWAAATGNPVINWHYSCWPAQFNCAPYVYGRVCQRHYREMRDVTLGSFLNGGFDMNRFGLSVSVWMKCLWNPEFDLNAYYDVFAKRMFGPAEKQMRRVVKLQEDGWMRGWKNTECSSKNVYHVSYPRKEVVEMEKLLDEADGLIGADPRYRIPFNFYRSGFDRFLKESAEEEKGTGFEPLYVKKALEQPKIDGVLDEESWKLATPMKFVSAYCRTNSVPRDGGEVRALWTPKGVTFGFRCDEHAIEHFSNTKGLRSFANETFDLFFDPSGEGEDMSIQLVIDARGCTDPLKGEVLMKRDGILHAWKVDKAKKEWTCELFVPYALFDGLSGAKFPTTSANGIQWRGNVTRWRVADAALPKEARPKDAASEATRLWTRYNWWNRDPTAFGKYVFVE